MNKKLNNKRTRKSRRKMQKGGTTTQAVTVEALLPISNIGFKTTNNVLQPKFNVTLNNVKYEKIHIYADGRLVNCIFKVNDDYYFLLNRNFFQLTSNKFVIATSYVSSITNDLVTLKQGTYVPKNYSDSENITINPPVRFSYLENDTNKKNIYDALINWKNTNDIKANVGNAAIEEGVTAVGDNLCVIM